MTSEERKIYETKREIEGNNCTYWNGYFMEYFPEIKRDSEEVFDIRKARRPCTKENLPPPGEILSLRKLVMNYLHMNLKYKTRPRIEREYIKEMVRKKDHTVEITETMGLQWTYVNYKYNERVIDSFDIPTTLKTELKELGTCESCNGHGYIHLEEDSQDLFRLRIKPQSVTYKAMETIWQEGDCEADELWVSIRDYGHLSPYDHYSSILFSLDQFRKYNRGIIGRLELSIPQREQIMEDIIRYQFNYPMEVKARQNPVSGLVIIAIY